MWTGAPARDHPSLFVSTPTAFGLCQLALSQTVPEHVFGTCGCCAMTAPSAWLGVTAPLGTQKVEKDFSCGGVKPPAVSSGLLHAVLPTWPKSHTAFREFSVPQTSEQSNKYWAGHGLEVISFTRHNDVLINTRKHGQHQRA